MQSADIPDTGSTQTEPRRMAFSDPLSYLKCAAALHNCPYFLIMDLAATGTASPQTFIASTMPANVQRLVEDNWLWLDLPVRQLRQSYLPMMWSLDTGGGLDGALRKEGGNHVDCPLLPHALCIPVHRPNKASGLGVFFTRAVDIEPRAAIDFHMACLHTFELIDHQTGSAAFDGAGLTVRECDCLSWTAAGKTSAEIGTILDISQHTVDHYLAAAIQKLNAVNRTQAVVKALHKDLIAFPPSNASPASAKKTVTDQNRKAPPLAAAGRDLHAVGQNQHQPRHQ